MTTGSTILKVILKASMKFSDSKNESSFKRREDLFITTYRQHAPLQKYVNIQAQETYFSEHQNSYKSSLKSSQTIIHKACCLCKLVQ